MSANPSPMNEISHRIKSTGSRQYVRNRLSTELSQSIVALRLTGQSISQIAKGLGVNRATVKAHCQRAMDKQASIQATLADIIPDAVKAVHECIKAGDGKLALALLERMNAIDRVRESKADASLSIAINTLISSPATTNPHPSGQEGEGDDLSLSSPRQNSPIIDAEVVK